MKEAIIFIDIKDLKPFEKNARINDKAVNAVANSIKRFGFNQPIVINQNNAICIGHTRYKAALELGLEKVPCIKKNMSDKAFRAYNKIDNKTNEIAQWDFDILIPELEDLSKFYDLNEFDIDLEKIKLDAGIGPEIEILEDEVPQLPEKPKTKLGQIYELGNHRLMCGDSTKNTDLEKLMNSKKADLIFTDPPYGINYNDFARVAPDTKKRGRFGKILNDDRIPDFLPQIKNILKENGSYYIFTAWEGLLFFIPKLREFSHVADVLVWDKNHFTMSVCDYKRRYELIIYGWLKKHKFYGPSNEVNVWQQDGFASFAIRREEEMVHPTQKPINLAVRAINNSSKKSDIVLDLFGGSGTTLIVCEQLNRKCYIMELDPRYCDVIIQRWERFTNERARKLN